MPRWCSNALMASFFSSTRSARYGSAVVFLSFLLTSLLCNTLFAADLPPPAGTSDTLQTPAPRFNTAPLLSQPGSSVLPVDTAFTFSVLAEAGQSKDGQNSPPPNIVLMWEIQPGYYLYQKSLAVETADGSPVVLAEFPPAATVTDEFFGTTAVYFDKLLVNLPLTAEQTKPGAVLEFLLTYQGCADQLYCYPPQQKVISLVLPE